MTAEHQRLTETRVQKTHWQRWGTYLSERAWSTVRNDGLGKLRAGKVTGRISSRGSGKATIVEFGNVFPASLERCR